MERERRRSPRLPFIAAVEVHEENTDSRLIARVSDISTAGCYIDTMNPLPDGASMRVRIINGTQSLEAAATIAYSHAHLGMGLNFRELQPTSKIILQEWLGTAV
jgi:hypothetical protein